MTESKGNGKRLIELTTMRSLQFKDFPFLSMNLSILSMART